MTTRVVTPERGAELLKLIAEELIVLDQSRERAALAERRIAEWRAEYDERRYETHPSYYSGPSVHAGPREACKICPHVG